MTSKAYMKFRNSSIRKKLLAINVSMILIMLILLGLSNYAISKKLLTEVSLDSSRKIVLQLGQNLDSKIQLLDDFMVKESFETQIYKALNPIYGQRSYDKQRILKTFSSNLMNYNKYIKVVLVEDTEKNQYQYAGYHWKSSEYADDGLLNTKKAGEMWGKNYWTPYSNELIFASRAVFDENSMEQVGVVSIGLDTAFFREIYQDLLNVEGNDIIILNQDYQVLTRSGSKAGDIAELIVKQYDLTKDMEKEFFYKDNKYILTLENLGKNGIKVMNLMNKKLISDRAVQMLTPTWYIAIAAIVLAVALTAWLYKDIWGNLQILMKRIRNMGRGDFSSKSVPLNQDEIGTVVVAFNQMSEKMTGLLDNISEEKVQKKNAQLKAVQFEYDALQARLNPHFLYNTLESINSLAKLNKNLEVSESISLLGDYLRETISRKKKFVLLSEEIENVKKYMKLQNISFGGRIQMEFELDEILMEAMVPKLILQPLVENAIVHGLEPKAGMGHIRIFSRCCRDTLEIGIEDDGVGIAEEWLLQGIQKTASDEKEEKHTKVGLEAVHKRIRILYGEGYGIEISKGKTGGTLILVKLPIIFEGEEREHEL